MTDDKTTAPADRDRGRAVPEPRKKPDLETPPPDDKKVEEDPSEQPS